MGIDSALWQDIDRAFREGGEKTGINALVENAPLIFRQEENYDELLRRKELRMAEELMRDFPPKQQCMTYQQARQRRPRTDKRWRSEDYARAYARQFRKCEHCGSYDVHEDGTDATCHACGTCSPQPFSITGTEHGDMRFEDLQIARSASGTHKKRGGYKRVNYLEILLERFLGRKEECPKTTLDAVRGDLTKRGLPPTLAEIRKAIRRLKLKGQHKFAGDIQRKLAGGTANIKEDELEFVRSNFAKIQKHFEGIRGLRKNFLNYRYVIGQLFRLCGRPDVAAEIPKLNNKQRMYFHDSLWREVCHKLDWPFFPAAV